MSAKTNEFLALYRSYENLVRAAGEDPKELESSMDGVLSSQMTMIRQFRNFLAHVESPGFLEPTDKMMAVLERQVAAWAMKGDVAKKHTKPASSWMCTESDACVDVMEKFFRTKLDRIVRAGKDGSYAVCGIHDVASAALASKRTKMSAVKPLKSKIAFARPDEPMSGLDPDRTTVCTADGTPEGKPVGLVVF